MIEELSIIRSAISEVVRFPVRSHTIFGGNPLRYEMFWSNSSFISNILQSSFSLRGKCKAGENILLGQLRKIRKYFVVGHTCRQPSQYIVNGDTSLPDTRFPKAFLGINSDNIVIISHNNLFFNNYSAKI